jgi:CRP-like cAMP-binding protein
MASLRISAAGLSWRWPGNNPNVRAQKPANVAWPSMPRNALKTKRYVLTIVGPKIVRRSVGDRKESMNELEATTLLPLVRELASRANVDNDDRDALLGLPNRQRNLPARCHVMRRGDSAEHSCVLISGIACSYRNTDAGGRQILALHMPGALIGFASTGGKVDDDVEALSAVECALVQTQELVALARCRPNIGVALWANSLAQLAICQERLVSLGRRSAYQRVSHFLCELVLRQNGGVPCEKVSPLPLTQEQLGDSLGLTSVHINRTLQRLRLEGLIQYVRHSLIVLDWAGLAEAGGFDGSYLQLEARSALSRE